jgi:predicted 3-demethylubiquinone-9 3-methyltransferase (glyoxalase superfamily)
MAGSLQQPAPPFVVLTDGFGSSARPMSSERCGSLRGMDTITPCLWFDDEAEAAAAFYTSTFEDSRILEVSHYNDAGPRPAGTVMVVAFEINGQRFTALNGGPQFTFSEAISFQVPCDSQDEVDHYWSGLTEGGEEGPCGWVKDRFGVSWQIFPKRMIELFSHEDADVRNRAMAAMMKMRKIDLAQIEEAAGAPA